MQDITNYFQKYIFAIFSFNNTLLSFRQSCILLAGSSPFWAHIEETQIKWFSSTKHTTPLKNMMIEMYVSIRIVPSIILIIHNYLLYSSFIDIRDFHSLRYYNILLQCFDLECARGLFKIKTYKEESQLLTYWTAGYILYLYVSSETPF